MSQKTKNASASNDYEVGYGKPPAHSRFQKGRSGNPRGRPKREAPSGLKLLEQALDGTILVNEGGRQQRITKREALFKTLVTRALKGDAQATSKVLTLMDEHGLMKDDIPRCIEVTFVRPGDVGRD